ncbi:MAG: primosomal protein N' [Candidatus Eremiobacteraeota bacterium]|nr:primosomal protein N' [Candidatus Eremiobacteraeota bacterium]
MPLSYAAGAFELRVGDVVRVPLGNRETLAYVIGHPHSREEERTLREVAGKSSAPRAFTEVGLALARFISEYYTCTLADALSAVVLSAAVPRTVDRFVRTVAIPNRQRYPSVPGRLVSLIWEDFPDGFALDQLLRHPDARRTGDRAALLRHVSAVVRSGELRRERTFLDPRMHEYRIKVLHPAGGSVGGPKAKAFVQFVQEQPGVPRADALLAGFSNAIIARAVKAGAIREEEISPKRSREKIQPAAEFVPTSEQGHALEKINTYLQARAFSEILLHGITGSGKTFVYIEVIKKVIREGGRAIVLVPEISLTPQTARRFEQAFGQRVAVLHSALSDRERYDAWQACGAGEIDVVVGARSAVFAPIPDVRLIVVDEAHESSYKQDTSPRYHAVGAARERMRIENGLLILGSATPALESYAAAQRGDVEYIALRERATRQALPSVRVVDMAAEFETGNRRIFSSALAQALDARIARKEKSVLFVNRRGSASFILCRACGFVPECERCSVSLTVHRQEGLLRCHYCDLQAPVPPACPSCGSTTIREFGIGTERVVTELERLYSGIRVIRMDSDTTTRVGDHARLLAAFEAEGDVLVGTQMVAKGLDFPQVTLVGVIAADIGLHTADFRAAERTFGLITQVCGRSGRAQPGEAIVQTYSPKHPAIRYSQQHDYIGFAENELSEREAAAYPPFESLIYLGVIGRSRPAVVEQARNYADLLRAATVGEVLGPAPHPIARLNNEWRYRIALKGVDAPALRAVIRQQILPQAARERNTRLAINVDP